MNNMISGLLTSGEAATIGAVLIFVIMIILMAIAVYVYSSFALMSIAHRTKTEPAWLAWIPVGNIVLISRIAGMHWWPILLLIPGSISFLLGFLFLMAKNNVVSIIFFVLYGIIVAVFGVYSTIWAWKMFEAVDRPGWWSLAAVIFSLMYLLLSLTKNPILGMMGALLSMVGTIVYLVFLGIAAWGNVSAVKNVPKKNTRRK